MREGLGRHFGSHTQGNHSKLASLDSAGWYPPYIAELEVEALHSRGDFTGRGVGREPLSFLPITGADHGRQVITAAVQR